MNDDDDDDDDEAPWLTGEARVVSASLLGTP